MNIIVKLTNDLNINSNICFFCVGDSMKCRYCGSNKIVLNGKRKRFNIVKQSYLCKSCKRQFINHDKFERMKYNPKIIMRSINKYKSGMSLSDVQNDLLTHNNIKISRWTISIWSKKFSV